MSDVLPPSEKFDLAGDTTSVGLRWERWERSLRIYFDAAIITSSTKKIAILLLLGGPRLQELFYNLPGASFEETTGVDNFEVAIKNLDKHFLPEQNKTYEKHIFRLIKQDIDQIVEKSTSLGLRKEILIIGDGVTIDKVIIEENSKL